ncbi:MAG: DUF4350 domain-containing protein [Phycisphaerae bacterium]
MGDSEPGHRVLPFRYSLFDIRYSLNRIILVVVLLTVAARGAVVGEIVRVGFPSVGGPVEGRDLVRVGSWVPVVVDLNVEGQASFDGWVRTSQPDKDGDRCYDMQKIQLMADTGGRRYTLYVVANPAGDRGRMAAVEVLDGDMKRVEMRSRGAKVWALTPVEPPEVVDANHFVVLSISSRTAGKVSLLQSPEYASDFNKVIRVAHIAPDDLPTRWFGLDVVDAVVWDEADPTSLRPRQLDALLEWVRQGGLLVIAAGRTADTLAQSKSLASVLPVEIGAIETTVSLPKLRRNFLGLADQGESFSSPIPVVTCRTRRGATTVLAEQSESFSSTVIARHRVGRGRVVFVAASLGDVFRDGGRVERFFKRVLEIRMPAPTAAVGEETRLFGEVDKWVGFTRVGSLYLVGAMVLAVVYVFSATIGLWRFLRRREQLQHSWSASALIALAASVLTVIGVQAVRGGVGKRLIQMSIVDAAEGESTAHATTYFGLKTSLFVSPDVWSPHDYPQVTEPTLSNCFLKPLPSSQGFGLDRSYADPGRYQLAASRAELLRVPIRGTVKQFESRWSGTMPGRLRANIRLARGPGGSYDLRVTPDSVIVNELGVDLYRSFLIYSAQDVFLPGSVVETVNRADKMYIFAIPALADGATLQPAQLFYRDQADDELEYDDWKDANALDEFLQRCSRMFQTINLRGFAQGQGPVGDLKSHEAMVMLASLLAEYAAPMDTGGFTARFNVSFAADGLRHLDLSHFVDRRHALFVGFSKAPGPVRLCTRSGGDDYEPVVPVEALTVYRVLIPVIEEG